MFFGRSAWGGRTQRLRRQVRIFSFRRTIAVDRRKGEKLLQIGGVWTSEYIKMAVA